MVPYHHAALFVCAWNEMPFNPNNEQHIARLRRSMDWSRKELAPFRKQRMAGLKEYVGSHYGKKGGKRIPANEIETLVSVLVRQLAANNPTVLATSRWRELKPAAASLQLRMNRMLKEIDLARHLREVLTDAMFTMGIARIGITAEPRSDEGDFWHDAGIPYFSAVGLDDWVMDMQAHRYDQVDYAGNRYRIPLEHVRNSDLYPQHLVDKLSPTPMTAQESGTDGGEGRAKSLTHGTGMEQSGEFQDHIELWDLWIPEMNAIVTLPDEGGDVPLRIYPYDGIEGGPYHLLGFYDVPGNPMPLSPVQLGMDLHLFINALYRKIFRQTERAKEVYWFEGEAAESMQRLVEASDGKVVKVQNGATGTGVHRSGGANPQGIAMALHASRMFSKRMGNLDLLGGLSPQSETLGQDEMLAGAANKKVSDMQDRFVSYVKKAVQSLTWCEWTEPQRQDLLVKRVADRDISELWAAETREGDFVQYDIDIEPYSMQHYSPASRLQTTMTAWQNVLLPAIMAGLPPEIIKKLTKLLSTYGNVPELAELMEGFVGFDRPEGGPAASGEPRQAATTNRINTRVNRSSGRDPDDELFAASLNAPTPEMATT